MKKKYDVFKVSKAIAPYNLEGSYKKTDQYQYLNEPIASLSTVFSQVAGINHDKNQVINSDIDSYSDNMSQKKPKKEKLNNFLSILTKFFSLNKESFINGAKDCTNEFIFSSENKL